jgi:peptidoglycan glycosyltransferase
VNRALVRLFALFTLLFTVLVVFTSRWSVFEAESLTDNTANRRPLLEQQKIPRGLMYARDGTVLAANRRLGDRQTRRHVRRYPTASLFSHAVGYSFIERGRAGLEQSRNAVLSGVANEFDSLIDELSGNREGENLRTALDPELQATARQALAGRRGSVVALEPETGRVRAMASMPDFDPNAIPESFEQLNSAPSSPLFNRATQARYPPGSTFKVVTAAAALDFDSGRFTADSTVSGRNNKPISGVPLQNFDGEDFGQVTLTEALTKSINTAWAEVGADLGKATMLRYMRRFGFGSRPPLDYPPNQLAASGIYGEEGLLEAGDPIDIGRAAIGQERLQVTPLQMAMVAAAIANGGVLMEPLLSERAIATDGRVAQRFRPQRFRRVIDSDAAEGVAAMMTSVVERGSGTAAKLQGMRVAGKTGTAERGGGVNQAWFVAFAPAERPRIALAVTVEQAAGTGGEVAAPIAQRLLEVALDARGAGTAGPAAAGGF